MPAYSDPNYMTKTMDINELRQTPPTGSAEKSEAISDRQIPGVGNSSTDVFATPQAKRYGNGIQMVSGGQGSPFGGHNMDERNQYTVKMPRGSSL